MHTTDSFLPLDLSRPLDALAVMRDLPVTEGVRGFMLNPLFARARAAGRAARLPTAVEPNRLFPIAMAIGWRFDVACALYPSETLRGALQRVGAHSHDALRGSAAGRAFVAARTAHDVSMLVAPGVSLVGRGALAELVEITERGCVVTVRNYRALFEVFVGAITRAYEHVGARATIRVRHREEGTADFRIGW
jgi:hypothetical protein